MALDQLASTNPYLQVHIYKASFICNVYYYIVPSKLHVKQPGRPGESTSNILSTVQY
jgi:hypothetical protein